MGRAAASSSMPSTSLVRRRRGRDEGCDHSDDNSTPTTTTLHRRTLVSRNDSWALYTRIAFSTMALFARSTLAASPAENGSGRELGHHANIVDLVICLASIIGSLIIIFPYIMSKNSRKLRHSLILGLAVSDLISSLVIVITTAFLLNGGNLIEADRFCTFLGFSLALSIYTQHFWNLFILIVTYMILVHPLSSFTLTIERRIIWLWPINLIFSLVINGIAWGVAGFNYSNGYCYVGGGGGLIFSSLFQLIPRAIVALVIIVFYTQLFFFLRRTNLMNASSSKAGSLNPIQTSELLSAHIIRDSDETSKYASSKTRDDVSESNKGAASAGNGSPGGAKTYLPLLDTRTIGGARGGTSTTSNTPSMPGRSPTSVAFGQGSRKPSNASQVAIEMMDYSAAPQSTSPQGSGALAPALYPPERPSLHGRRSRSLSDIGPGPSLDLARTASHTDTAETPAQADDSMTQMKRPLLPSRRGTDMGPGGGASIHSVSDSGEELPDYHTWAGIGPAKPRKDLRDFEMVSPPREHLRHLLRSANASSNSARPQTAPSHRMVYPSEEDDAERAPTSRRAPDSLTIDMTANELRANRQPYEEGLGENWTWGMNVTPTDADQAGITRIQTIGGGVSVAHNASRRGSAATGPQTRSNGGGLHGLISSRHTSSSDEHGVENLGSTLNRQASALLLLYPLAYLILFSISLIRIIRDLADPAGRALRSTDTLANISRWLIFAQGLLDCIIFKVIERQFRLRMKRKRARARGEDPGRTSSQKVWTWFKVRVLRRPSADTSQGEKFPSESRRPSVV